MVRTHSLCVLTLLTVGYLGGCQPTENATHPRRA